MLQAIRDRATGWIAWAIVILISVPFALWGIQQYMVPEGNVTIASVNGTEIGYQRFQTALARRHNQLRAMLGGAYRPDLIDEETIRQQTIEGLVNDELIVQTGLDDGLRVGDAQLAGAIRTQPVFLQTGQFSQEAYEGWLRSQGYTPGAFEFDLRRSLLSEQILSGLSRSDFVTGAEVERIARLQTQKRVLATLTVPRERYRDIDLSEEEIRAYFDENQEQFRAPERLDLEFVTLSPDDIAATVEASDEVLRQIYEDRKDTLFTPESREASHILVSLDRDADDAAVEAARAKLLDLKARIEGGESFAELAKEHSEDIGSATVGGELGAFTKDVMDPAFERAAFSMSVDEISDPVKSAFGLHLIHLTKIIPSGEAPFEDVAGDLAFEYRNEQGEQLFFEQTDQLVNAAWENPDSLGPAADTLGLEIGRTGLGSRNDPAAHELLRNERIWQAALGSKVFEDGLNSDMIDLGNGDIAFIRLVEHVPEAALPFEEARTDAERALREERASGAAREAGEALVERLRGGDDPATVASEAEADWTEEKAVDRFAGDPDTAVVEAAFRLARPDEGETVYDGVEVVGGDYVVYAFSGVEEGSAETIDEARRVSTRSTLESDLGRRSFDAVVAELTAAADIVMRTDSLDDEGQHY